MNRAMRAKRVLLGLLAVVAAVALGFYFQLRPRPVVAPVTAPPVAAEVLTWDPVRVTQMVAQVEAGYRAALVSLQTHDYAAAHRHAILEGREVAAPYVEHFPSNAVKLGLMMEDWAKRLELPYRIACSRELDWCIEALKTRAIRVEQARVLVNLHGDYPELKEKLEGLKPQIDAMNAKAPAK